MISVDDYYHVYLLTYLLTYLLCRPLFRYMRNDLARLKIRCKNHRLGCDHVSSLEFAQAHARTSAPWRRCIVVTAAVRASLVET